MFDAAEMGVDVTAIGDLLDLREDVVEVLRPLEEPEAAGVHVREVQDRQDALCVLHERQDFVQAADDLRASARLDPEAGVDLRLLVRVPDGPEVLGDPIQGLLRIELPEHAEVRNHDRSAHRLREHAAPDHALDALLGEPVRVRRVRPLQDSGMPEGPKRITRSPNGGWPPLDYYSVRPDISTFAALDAASGGRRRPAGPVPPRNAAKASRFIEFSAGPAKGRSTRRRPPKCLSRPGLLAPHRGPFHGQAL